MISPSASNAFVNGIMEGVDYFYDEATGEYKEEKTKNVQGYVHKLSKSQLEERKLAIFENFVASLLKKA